MAIGRAIVREPRVFLFDEPLSNLDAELRVQMRSELMDLHRRLGATMIYVTHDQVEAMTLADKMVVLNGGRIQQVGAPLALYDDPDNLFVAGFVGSPKMNFLAAKVEGDRLTGLGGQAAMAMAHPVTEREVTVGIRPEHLRLAVPSETLPQDAVAMTGKVGFVEQLGDMSYVHLALADGTNVVARTTARWGGAPEAQVILDPAKVLLFGSDGQRIRSRAQKHHA